MKRILLVICVFLLSFANAQILKGGIEKEYIPSGFFGSWGVVSKLDSSNNPMLFNSESRDIWTLSGNGNLLILENRQSGAISQIEIKDKTKDGRTLKFEREKTVIEQDGKVVYREIVSFVLLGESFSGTDDYIVERYDKKNKIIKKDCAKYLVAGVKIP